MGCVVAVFVRENLAQHSAGEKVLEQMAEHMLELYRPSLIPSPRAAPATKAA